jgi:hypothetical protein
MDGSAMTLPIVTIMTDARARFHGPRRSSSASGAASLKRRRRNDTGMGAGVADQGRKDAPTP